MQRVLQHVLGMVLSLGITLCMGAGSIAEGLDSSNGKIEGEFFFTQSRQCINSSAGFGGPSGLALLPIPPGGFLNRAVNADRGIVRFNEDGTGTFTFRATQINLNVEPPGIPVTVSEGVGNFTFIVNPDGTVDIEAAVTFTVVAGETPAPRSG